MVGTRVKTDRALDLCRDVELAIAVTREVEPISVDLALPVCVHTGIPADGSSGDRVQTFDVSATTQKWPGGPSPEGGEDPIKLGLVDERLVAAAGGHLGSHAMNRSYNASTTVVEP